MNLFFLVFAAPLVEVMVYREYTSRAGKVTIMWWYAIFELWFILFIYLFLAASTWFLEWVWKILILLGNGYAGTKLVGCME